MLPEWRRPTTSISMAGPWPCSTAQRSTYLHDDRLGTPQLATDSTQNIQWQASYEPFGTTPSVSGTITQNLRFPGQYFDVESGWNHNGFRDYLPALGRYAEPDPLGRLGSGNDLYAYVGDNPANLVDPLGLCFLNYRSHARRTAYNGAIRSIQCPLTFNWNTKFR